MSSNRHQRWFNPCAKAIYRAMKSEDANRRLPIAHGDPQSEEVTEKTPTRYKALLAMQRGEWSDKAGYEMRGHIAEVHAGLRPKFKRKRRVRRKKKAA